MKIKLVIFILGALVGGLMSFLAGRYYYQRNILSDIPVELRQQLESMACGNLTEGRRIGPVCVFTGKSDTIAAIALMIKPIYPLILLQDKNLNGTPDGFVIADKELHLLDSVDKNEDGIWDSFSFYTGVGTNSEIFIDRDLDGVYEFKLGPGKKKFIRVDSQWEEIMSSNNATHAIDAGASQHGG